MGTLYIIATPIGNLEDITLRALRLLREADLIAAEDTRHTRKLLAHFEIDTPLIAYHQHSDRTRAAQIIRRMSEDDQTVALVTDAGTPGVSDPGVELVAAAIAAGIAVVSIPGASAALCALVGSGLPPARFAFEGFLPRTRAPRRAKLAALADEPRTLIFYEAPGRTAATLSDLAAVLGADRQAAVGRELTKKHEEFVRGGLGELASRFMASPPRGEITIVVAGKSESEQPEPPVEAEQNVASVLTSALRAGMTERDAVRQVSADLKVSKRAVYAAMLALKREAEAAE